MPAESSAARAVAIDDVAQRAGDLVTDSLALTLTAMDDVDHHDRIADVIDDGGYAFDICRVAWGCIEKSQPSPRPDTAQ